MHRNPNRKSSKIQNTHKKIHGKSKQETAFCLNLVALVFDLSYIHLSRFQRLRFSDAHFEFFHISIYPFSREFDVCDSVMPILCVSVCMCVCVFILFIVQFDFDFNVFDSVTPNLSFSYISYIHIIAISTFAIQ